MRSAASPTPSPSGSSLVAANGEKVHELRSVQHAPAGGGSPLDDVLRLLGGGGPVTGRTRQSAQRATCVVAVGEPVVGAYRCGIVVGATQGEGVAVLTSERLSVVDRRGFRSLDQRLHLTLSTPFTVESGPRPTDVTIAAPGAPSVTLDLLDVRRAQELREQLEGRRSDGEEGWWSQLSVAWPGWLGSTSSWRYLGGDPRLARPTHELRVHVGPTGVMLGGAGGTTGLLAAWPNVRFVHVVGAKDALQRATAQGLVRAGAFAATWRTLECSAFIVVGYATGEDVFLGTTDLTEPDLRARLLPLAEAIPSSARGGGEVDGGDPVHRAATVADAASEGDARGPDLATQLERVAALHARGLLDDGDFARAKSALLGGFPHPR